MATSYVNGLKFSIQDELSMHHVNNMKEARLNKSRIGNITRGIEVVKGVHQLHFGEVLIMAGERFFKALTKL